MGMQLKTKGLVLHEMPIGENDKRIILLTKEKGKITAFARGARKSNSKLLSGTQIFSYGDFILYKGKSSYNVNQVSLIKSFYNIRTDIEDLTWGLYILEFIDYVSNEENPNTELMLLVLKTLQILDTSKFNSELIIEIFEIKAMALIGLSPWVSSCIKCGSKNIMFFSSEKGGSLCEECSRNVGSLIDVSKGTIYAIEYILSTKMENLFSFNLNDKNLQELKLITNQFLKYNLDKEFKALDFFAKI
jgi:DNA repair protein RecO (recombination protein O)